MSAPPPVTGAEHGDRAGFLGRLRSHLADGVPENLAHRLPAAIDAVPVPRSTLLDPHDLLGSFERAATTLSARVHRVPGDAVPVELVQAFVERHGVHRAVVSAAPLAQRVGATLTAIGVEVSALSVAAAADADLGVTSATFGLATTGTVVQDSLVEGGRTASLLPPAHLCILPAERIVASTTEVLRALGARTLPSNLVLVTGPSRSGDIEQIIVRGVHGPIELDIVVLTG